MGTLLRIVLCAILAPLLAGCLQAGVAMEGVGTFSGPKAIYREIKPLANNPDARPLGRYSRFETAAFQDGSGGMVPPEFLSYIPQEIKTRLADLHLSNSPKGRTVIISGRILYYEEQSLVRALISPLEEVIARVELIDKETGEVIGVAVCVSRVTARTQTQAVRDPLRDVNVKSGVRIKAVGLAKAIYEWIRSRYPENKE